MLSALAGLLEASSLCLGGLSFLVSHMAEALSIWHLREPVFGEGCFSEQVGSLWLTSGILYPWGCTHEVCNAFH